MSNGMLLPKTGLLAPGPPVTDPNLAVIFSNFTLDGTLECGVFNMDNGSTPPITGGNKDFELATMRWLTDFQNVTYDPSGRPVVTANRVGNDLLMLVLLNIRNQGDDMPCNPSGGHICSNVSILRAGGVSCPYLVLYNPSSEVKKLKLFYYEGPFQISKNAPALSLRHYMIPMLTTDLRAVYYAIENTGAPAEQVIMDLNAQIAANPNSTIFFGVDDAYLHDDKREISLTFEARLVIE